MRLVLHSHSDAALMSMLSLLRSVGNKIYRHAFPIYRPLYAAYKTYTDRAERQLLRKVLFQGAVVVDVGANIGIYSEFLSRCVGPTGSVHAFEPSPDNFKRLSAATHGLSNIQLTQGAVGERSGECKLYVSDKLNVDHRTHTADGDSRRAVPAEMVALDDYFRPGQCVDLIKMDIQGYELHALMGAQRVLRENPDINLLLEFWPAGLEQAGVSWEGLVEMLQGLNMNLALVRTGGLVPFDAHDVRNDISWYVNLFAHRKRGQTRN
ncbi:MAG: FkbM family methyltransferase [Verrucomicrobia bacterium]|nr:MAG: FkbM family methyltransferase [Verrucomicrobiota bacterium]